MDSPMDKIHTRSASGAPRNPLTDQAAHFSAVTFPHPGYRPSPVAVAVAAAAVEPETARFVDPALDKSTSRSACTRCRDLFHRSNRPVAPPRDVDGQPQRPRRTGDSLAGTRSLGR